MLGLMTEETSLWKGGPSQWLNLGPFALAIASAAGIIVGGTYFPAAFFALVLPLIYGLWRYYVVSSQIYELTNERLRVTCGIINQKIDEIELYRVKDLRMIRPWWMRLTGLSSILMETSDRSIPTLVIPAVRRGVEVRELLRKNVELQRDRKRVREMDFDEHGGDAVDHG